MSKNLIFELWIRTQSLRISKLVLLPFENFGRSFTNFPAFLRRRRKFLEFLKPKSPDIVLKIPDFSKKFPESWTGIPDKILISDFGKSGSRPRKTSWVSAFRELGRLVPWYIPKAGTEPVAFFWINLLNMSQFLIPAPQAKILVIYKADKLKFFLFQRRRQNFENFLKEDGPKFFYFC